MTSFVWFVFCLFFKGKVRINSILWRTNWNLEPFSYTYKWHSKKTKKQNQSIYVSYTSLLVICLLYMTLTIQTGYQDNLENDTVHYSYN